MRYKKNIRIVGAAICICILTAGFAVAIDLSGLFNMARPWDIDQDGTCNYIDTGACALVYGSEPYTGREDVTGDNKVNYLDTGELALQYGNSY